MRISDWSSDVCSSDLKIVVAKDVMSSLVRQLPDEAKAGLIAYGHHRKGDCMVIESLVALGPLDRDAMIRQIEGLNAIGRSEERRVGKECVSACRSRRSPLHEKKNNITTRINDK